MRKNFTWIYLVLTLLLGMAAIGGVVRISLPTPPPAPKSGELVFSTDTLAAGPSAYLLAELSDYRRYLETERREYQQFLTRTYATIGILITAVTGILTFLGIKTLADLKRKSEREIEAARRAILQEAKQNLRRESAKLLKKELKGNQRVVKALAELGRRQALWSGASLRIIGSQAVIEEMKQPGGVIAHFQQGSAKVIPGPFQQGEALAQYDAVVYCYQPVEMRDEAGKVLTQKLSHGKEVPQLHDPFAVEKMIPAAQKADVPLVVYTYRQASQSNRLDGKTFAAINDYLRGSAANFPASLIANTYDAITLFSQASE